ncbi:MAG: hypothetical protein K2M59_03260 [Muribaculaceae bacterium]|nr:hypothetical protein [Muribaculaceae bacterium]
MLKKKIKITSLSSLLLMAVWLLASCHDDIIYPSLDPEVTGKEGYTITSFSLESAHFNIGENVDSVRISLIGLSGTTQCFGAGVTHSSGTTRFRMVIPDSAPLPDGKYILTMRNPDGRSIPGRLSTVFKSGMLSSISIILPSYMLDGDGTEDSPYLIKNNEDFSMFLINLADDDESYGAGLVFKQTGDVAAPDQSALIPGRGYWGAPFAGIYKGENNKIRGLYYRGSGRESADTGIGLFNRLLGTASVENLSLTNVAMSGLCAESGVVAGETLGEIRLSNISVGGFIEDGSKIGGVIGCVKSGTLYIDNVNLELSVRGESNIGGIAGVIEKEATLYVSGVKTPNSHFNIKGATNIGGIVGLSQGILSATDITLDHKVGSEDSDINIIEASSQNVGGIAGMITSDAGNHAFIRCRIMCPVGGDKASYVGGLAGVTSQTSELLINDCRMLSIIEGVNYVGGMFGKAEFQTGAPGVKIIGSDPSVRVTADDADARISGKDYVGGFAGWWRGTLSAEGAIKINLPVKGEGFTGGAFGALYNTNFDATRFTIGQANPNVATTMRITGGKEAGGFVGHLEESTLTGSTPFDYNEGKGVRVPEQARFIPLFAGVIVGEESVGGLVGYAKNSKLKALSSGSNVTGKKKIGGVIGHCEAADKSHYLEDLTFTGKIECPEAEFVGGIAGLYYVEKTGLIHDCVNYGHVSGGDQTGGIIGELDKEYPYGLHTSSSRRFDLKWCVNLGDISGNRYVGGIVGIHYNIGYDYIGNENDYLNTSEADVLFTYCMNGGEIKATGIDNSIGGVYKDLSGVGGIIGFSGYYAGIMNCANHGDVYGSGRFHGVGGVAGSAGFDVAMSGALNRFRNVDVKQCMNSATVSSGNRDTYVGGVIGYLEEGNKSDVNDCYNTGNVPCNQKHDSGGIIGTVDHLTNIYRCVNWGIVSYGNAIIGTHKTGSLFDHGALYFLEGTGKSWPSAKGVSKANFTKESSFSGLDFTNNWQMTSYGPELRDCPWQNPELVRPLR